MDQPYMERLVRIVDDPDEADATRLTLQIERMDTRESDRPQWFLRVTIDNAPGPLSERRENHADEEFDLDAPDILRVHAMLGSAIADAQRSGILPSVPAAVTNRADGRGRARTPRDRKSLQRNACRKPTDAR